jgi:uncharacterized membrane protein YdbT with pleckstrin-like domain
MRRLRIHWAWVPAGVFAVALGWHRYGWWTLLIVLAGLALGIGVEVRARK